MNQQSTKEKAETLIGDLEKYGQGDYIGESISQLEHCLQAAHQAHKASTYCSYDFLQLLTFF
jgi:predicted HD phosphohydrolase